MSAARYVVLQPQWWIDTYAELERGGYCDSPGGMECARVYAEFIAAGSPLIDAREFIVKRANALPDGTDGPGLAVREHMRQAAPKVVVTRHRALVALVISRCNPAAGK